MKRRYILAPQAARDLVAIWRYLKQESSKEPLQIVAILHSSRDVAEILRGREDV